MVVSCCAIGCKNQHGERPGLGFSSEPEERSKRWIHAVRKDWKPAKHTQICGEHFVSSEYIFGGQVVRKPS